MIVMRGNEAYMKKESQSNIPLSAHNTFDVELDGCNTGSISVAAPAKINLFLEVGKKRADGYHEIDTVMQSVGLCDTVSLRLRTDDTVHLTVRGAALGADENNLAYRAAVAFLQAYRLEGGVDILLEKQIPMGAGLGGGSADAAAVLRGLSFLYHKQNDLEELCEIGKTLGADVPFCVRGGACHAAGIGEKLTPIPSLPPCTVLIAKADVAINTAYAYRALDALRGGDTMCRNAQTHVFALQKPAALLTAVQRGDLSKISKEMFNRFCDVVLPQHKEICALQEMIVQAGATGVMMSGSGSAVFGLFEVKKETVAASTAQMLRNKGYFAAAVSPLTHAPEMQISQKNENWP